MPEKGARMTVSSSCCCQEATCRSATMTSDCCCSSLAGTNALGFGVLELCLGGDAVAGQGGDAAEV